jgi:tetratricopeptide (TPR) repeat protein
MKNIVIGLTLVLLAFPVSAQQWQWPEHPTNLKVLPKGTGGKELQNIMFSYSNALGARCNFCHATEEGKVPTDADFASDENPEKNVARTMIQMVDNINNQFIAKLQSEGSGGSLEVSCITCHRGNSTPVPLEDKLMRTYNRSGIDSTIAQYHELRDKYYGGFTYDFKEWPLQRLADMILQDSTKKSDAMQILKLNIEMNPSFGMSYARLGGLYEDQGDTKAAIENYQQAVKLDPRNGMVKRRLEVLQGNK